MSVAPFGFGRLWPVIPAAPDDEATPVGLAPGQMPVDPRRDGSVQPTAAGKNLSRAVGVVAGNAAQGLLDAARLPGDVYAGRIDPMSDEGRQRAFDLAGTLATGGMPMAEAGAAGIFGGRLARGADHEALKRAESMAAWGEPRRDIWEDTGWFQGSDRQWRFEIPDDKARLSTAARREFSSDAGVTTGDLGQQFVHSGLINNYPDAGRLRLDIYKTASKDPNYSEGGYGNARDSAQKVIWGKASTPEAANNFTLHELQHHIQDTEGFARGAAPERFTREMWAQEQMAPHQAAVRDLAEQYPGAEAAVRLRDDTRAGLERDFGADWRNKASADRLDAMDEAEAGISLTAGGHDFAKVQAAHDKRRSFVDDDTMAGWSVPLWQQEKYRLTAGEVEARNVEARRTMTAEERRATPPWETQDTPDARQIIFREPPTGVSLPSPGGGQPRALPVAGAEAAAAPRASTGSTPDIGDFNLGDELAALLSGSAPARGILGAMGAGAAAAALAPGDAQATPSPSGAPMAFGFGSLSGLPADVLLRQRQGTPQAMTLDDPVATMLGPDQAQARPPAVPPQEPPVVAPFGFGALAPRASAAAASGMGFGLGSPGAGLPLPLQEPTDTGATTPAARPVSRQSAPPPPAPSRAMTSAPLPPARPPEFGSSADPGQPLEIKPTAAAAAPAEPSTWDGVRNFLGSNSDMLIGIGTGLMSTPGISRAVAAGVQNGVAMQNASAAQGLARAKQAVEMQKLAREQGGITANAGLLKRAYPGVTDEQATALAATPSNVQEALKILRDPNHGTGVPAGWRMRADGQGYEPITGGPQDPATKEADAAAQARGTAAGKPEADEAGKLKAAMEARRAAAPGLGLVEGSPAWQSFVGTGKIGRDQDLSATDKQAIQEADDNVLAAQNAISALRQARELSKKAYDGPTAGIRGTVTSMFGSEAGVATRDLDNVVTTNSLGQLKAIFGGNPTEGERKILLDVQGAANQPEAVRNNIFERAAAMAEKRLEYNQRRADELRGGTYYKKGSGAPAAPQGDTPAPASSPAPQGAGTPDPLAAARAAISQGADRKAVIQRLLQNKIDPRGL